MSLTVMPGKAITTDVLTAYSVTQDEQIWLSGTTYPKSAWVVLDEFGSTIYESLADNNFGNNPADPLGTSWVDLGIPSNRASMFDSKISTKTRAIETISLTVDLPGFTNTFSALGLENVKSITVTAKVGGVAVWTDTRIAYKRQINSIYDMFFGKHVFTSDVVFTNLPQYKDQTIEVVFTGDPSIEIAVGDFMLGERKIYGNVQWQFASRRKTYTARTEDTFGNTIVVKRLASSKRVGLNLVMPPERVAGFEDDMVEIDGIPVLWILSERYTSTILKAYYDDFESQFSDNLHAYTSLKLTGTAQ
ncbi:MAG: hypothetical protein COW76_05140 [Shewanella sp. CG18_big_fil_WC_8_21_14_2_50_42_11]|uniref:hypothetical protein n=1 Tax=Shewanella sp. CG18_big_fil_WC_8_21_14_2_50_42_11 TaxID=1975538 RepID=UPI000C569914|nr:hypothetical protein [Shewanella sp. CG18_big_fil_WC_8_21_14_2_50_42_11]PIQ01472.1 MAG: hypothetical protein COW76_05140 [Shewanella sp. CG18_big_fil_WC_8_21_14_2_50_42_11]